MEKNVRLRTNNQNKVVKNAVCNRKKNSEIQQQLTQQRRRQENLQGTTKKKTIEDNNITIRRIRSMCVEMKQKIYKKKKIQKHRINKVTK